MSNQLVGWDIEGGGGSKVEFTKFPEGLTKIRLVDTVPNIRWTHWINAQRTSVNCSGNDCPICEIRKKEKANGITPTHGMGRRFALQIINRNTGKLEIMEQGKTFFEDLKIVLQMAVEEGKDITSIDLSVRRKGMGKDDTTYRIDVAEEYEYTEKDLELMAEKLDLDEYFKPSTPEQINRILAGEKWSDVMADSNDEEDNDDEVILE